MKKYWKDLKSKDKEEPIIVAKKETSDTPLLDIVSDENKDLLASRRDFLKLCGFSFAVSALVSCRDKITKAVPYVYAPVELTPGNPLFYASSYVNGNEYCSIIVKNRDGRPIKIEGNPESSITRGGTTARVQASVLDLYDGGRFHNPMKEGNNVSWDNVDQEITGRLKEISSKGGTIVILTPTIFSPSTESIISGFIKKFPGTEWIRYDAISYSALLEANKESFGKQVIPDYRFDKANLIVSFGADFLGTWLSPVEYIKQFSSKRIPEHEMNHLIQLESRLSLTGSNADKRIQIKPSQEMAALANIYKEIVMAVENRVVSVPTSSVDVSDIAKKLIASRGKSLVVSGSNLKNTQLLVNEINRLLGNIGQTILFSSYLRTHSAIDKDMELLVQRMKKGNVSGLLMWNVNPAYTWYKRDEFIEGLKKTGLTVSMSGAPDETNNLVNYVCPDNHYLESWNDAEPKKDYFSIVQPVTGRIFNTRQMIDSLLKWSDSGLTSYEFIHAFWVENMMSRQTEIKDPVGFFDNYVQKGVFEPSDKHENEVSGNIKPLAFNSGLIKEIKLKDTTTELILYESVALGEGRQANNPWLQELPDPVSKICWDNYLSISPLQAREFGLVDNDVLNIGKVELPVLIQPGQAYGTFSAAVGYGRSHTGMVADGIGVDVWQLLNSDNGNIVRTANLESITKTGKVYPLAMTQTHHSMEGREFVREAQLKKFREDPAAGNELHAISEANNKSLYKEIVYPHHHWGMAIDLSKCTGCATCVIACQAENNVPVVGKEEVERVHEMHWLRIDRYYTDDENNPEVVFQPVLCQHCKNAPCENVCPVAATNHSSEGLNQMIYNRCFGTRYCNNNCPYKVRRFNWFNYTAAGTLTGNLRDKEKMTSDIRRMVLNPDVTVRAQGVIEKCSFCIQRIQAAKLKAKYENRALIENEFQTACAQACPADAIIFGDMNDKNSVLMKLINSGRRYNLLEELYTMPSVNYLTKIRNNNINS